MPASESGQEGHDVGQAQERELLIVHVVPRLYVGGINQALLSTLTELVHGPHPHLVVSLSDSLALAPAIEALGVEVVSLHHRGNQDAVRTLRRLRELVRSRPVDLIHAHHFLGRTYAVPVGRLARLPVVATLHNIDSPLEIDPDAGRLRARVMGSVQHLVDRGCTRLVVVSQAVADVQLGDHQGLARRAVVIPNGIDVDRFAVPGGRGSAARGSLDRELGLDPAATVLVNIGRMVYEKDQRQFVPIVDELARGGLDVHAVIVGEGPDAGPVAAAAAAAGVADRIHLLGHRDDVPQLLAAADVVVVPSIKEGFSLAVLEAMAARRPIVASDIPPIAEAVRPGVDGLLVPAGDASAFAAAIRSVLADPDAATGRASSASTRVRASFTAAAAAARLTGLYEEMASGPVA